MSSATRDHRIVRRMTSLPRSIMGGISRAMGDGMGFVGIGRRRNQHTNFPLQPQSPLLQQDPLLVPEEWTFLESFEQQYGTKHPFFYACRFMEAMRLTQQDQKFMFMYLHSPDHPFANVFCKDTLCSELVIQFLDVNFICWGALADRGEGLQMVASLRPDSFPCCAVISPAPSDSIVVLQEREFRSQWKLRTQEIMGSFLCTDKIQFIFSYIDSLGLPGIENYRLISNFPRKAYGVDQMRMTLKDAGLYPKASLFLSS